MNNLSGRLLSVLKYIVLLSLAGVLLWLSFREVKWESFVNGIKDADWRWIGLSMIVSVLADKGAKVEAYYAASWKTCLKDGFMARH